jgi:serine/threonine protein phosphatase PrpC
MGVDDTAKRGVASPLSGVRHESAGRTHPGKVRAVNEDALIERPDIGLWAVADGVGGATAGARASALVVESLASVSPPISAQAILDEVCERLRAANRLLVLETGTMGGGSQMASTVVVLLFAEGFFACAWAGDSRLYLMRDGALHQVTHDHSAVQELVDTGLLTGAQARGHPRSNVITRAVGAEENIALDMVQDRVRPGDLFLICSDGLTKMLDDSEIGSRLDARPVAQLVDALIEATLERGATDNVTVVAVRAIAAAEGGAFAP